MNNIYLRKVVICATMLLSLVAYGCKGSVTAPSGSTITINPTTVSVTDARTTVSTNTQYFTITVTDSNGNPLNDADVAISFPWAVPNSAGSVQLYNGSSAVNSPFTAKTNSSGVYLLRFDYNTGGGLAYTGDLEARSGTAFGKSTVTIQ